VTITTSAVTSWASVLPRIDVPPPSLTCCVRYRGALDQVRAARAVLACLLDGCPAADDAVLLVSELCANAIQHSDSREPGGGFSVHIKICQGDGWVWCGVEDEGGKWTKRPRDTGRMHGLGIVAALADDWGVVSEAVGRLVWFRLGWRAGAATVALAP